jgi:anti-sigma regulatory factor (Ser/Thr protein kinase)
MSGRADAVSKADSVTSAVSGGNSSSIGPASIRQSARRSYLELGALPTAVPCARLHARQVLWEWGLYDLAETVELLVSELVTNALKATAGRDVPAPIRLQLSSDGARLLIEVWDADPRPPVPKELGEDNVPDFGTEGGRGLFLVDHLSERWSWYAARQWGGKVVWAEVGP